MAQPVEYLEDWLFSCKCQITMLPCKMRYLQQLILMYSDRLSCLSSSLMKAGQRSLPCDLSYTTPYEVVEPRSRMKPFLKRQREDLSVNAPTFLAIAEASSTRSIRIRFIHSFIQAISIAPLQLHPLQLRGVSDTARILCRNFTLKRHRQLWVKELPYRSLRGG